MYFRNLFKLEDRTINQTISPYQSKPPTSSSNTFEETAVLERQLTSSNRLSKIKNIGFSGLELEITLNNRENQFFAASDSLNI
ncbi:hypothetical protein [Gottfriedia acidiceleris]|uniref:hypothetical protein n=1 Tax=Gottfriedia acidiceleris TaxID=371036 RepID=UPI00101CAAAD|nr:hypothetical protein [Gottfriedia acidiceleris]